MNRITAIILTLLRPMAAVALFAVCASHWWSTTARAEFDALPDYDFAAAAEAERAAGHYSEALMIVGAGLDTLSGEKQADLFAVQTRIETERDDVLRRLREAARGALTGTGESTEALAGAVAADLLVIGDVRDLVIQGAKLVRGEEPDKVIVALSGIGLATTLAPEADAGISVLTFARRVGAITDALASSLIRVVRRAVDTRNADELVQVANDASRLATAAKPAAALKILKLVDDPETLHLVADFSQRPGGAFALWLGGERSLGWLKSKGQAGEDWLLRAARRGEPGLALLASKGTRLLRPHPLLGLLKGIYRGNVPALLLTLLENKADALFGLATGWLLFELVLLKWRLRNFEKHREALRSL